MSDSLMQESADSPGATPTDVIENKSGTVAGAATMSGTRGRFEDIPVAAEDAVEVEGAIDPDDAAPGGGVAVAYLFQPNAAPRATSLHELPALVSDDANFAWIDLTEYATGDLEGLAGLLNLHKNAVHGALSAWKRPRLDVYGDHFLVTATIPQLDHEAYRVHAHQLDLFVGRNYLLSAHKRALPFADRVMTRAIQSPDLLHHDAAFMLYIVLDEMLAYYEQLHERMQEEIETLEERALSDTSDAYLRDLLRFKRYAFAVSQLADHHREVFAAFLRPDFHWVSGEDVATYYRDLEARLARLTDALLAAREAVKGAFDIYVSHVSHRTSNVMKILTMVSTVLLPDTVILAFFGTNNIQGIPLLVKPSGFILMMGAIVIVNSVVLWIYHRQGWF